MPRTAYQGDPRLSRYNPLPRILALDDFNTGTHGWVELLGNYDGRSNLDTVDDHMRDFRPPQLSACSFFDVGTHGTLSGTYALKVATRPEADGVRYHTVVRYLNTDLHNQLRRQWVYPVVPEPTPREHLEGKLKLPRLADFTAPNPDDWHPFGEQDFCYNEVPTKINWHYLRWLIDTSTRSNVELQVNDRVFDMRDVPVPPYAEYYGSLQNLLNFYVSVRTHTNVRNFLYLDTILLSVDW